MNLPNQVLIVKYIFLKHQVEQYDTEEGGAQTLRTE